MSVAKTIATITAVKYLIVQAAGAEEWLAGFEPSIPR
jgi:hypothetical protein